MSEIVPVGIDLGAENSCVAVVQDITVQVIENEMHSRTTPSYVAFTDTERLTGNIAKYSAEKHLCSPIYAVKQILGRGYEHETVWRNEINWHYKLQEENGKVKIKARYRSKEKLFAPEEITAMLLTNLKDTAKAYLKQEITNVVIPVPSFFNDLQRRATIDAGFIAGLNVSIINEPAAAALTFCYYQQNNVPKTVLFFDFGYGKLEVSIVQFQAGSSYNFEIKSTAHNMHLGGADLDKEMVDFLMTEFKNKHCKDMSTNTKSLMRLLTEWKKTKIVLSSNMQATITVDSLFEGLNFTFEITRDIFEKKCRHLLEEIIEPVETALNSAKIHKSKIDEVVVIGGSSRIPKVQQLLRDFFDEKVINKSLNPDEAIVIGATLHAFQISHNILNYFSYTLPYSLMCLARKEEKEMLIIFNKGTIPGNYWFHSFHTTEDNQTEMKFSIYQVDFNKSDLKIVLGTHTYTNIPPAPKGTQIITLACNINANGICFYSLYNTKTCKWDRIQMNNKSVLLSKEELQRLQKEAEHFNDEEREQKAKAEVIYKFEQFLYKTKTPEHSPSYNEWYSNYRWLEENRGMEANKIETMLKTMIKAYNLRTSQSHKTKQIFKKVQPPDTQIQEQRHIQQKQSLNGRAPTPVMSSEKDDGSSVDG